MGCCIASALFFFPFSLYHSSLIFNEKSLKLTLLVYFLPLYIFFYYLLYASHFIYYITFLPS